MAVQIVDPQSNRCACGEPLSVHRCPSSQGYAPRAPKTASCRTCGEKAHQNLEQTTVRLECLWRQWAKATGQLRVKSGRLALPPVTADNLTELARWLAGTSTVPAAPPASLQADGTFAAPDTAATLRRMATRAATAPPMPSDPDDDDDDDNADGPPVDRAAEAAVVAAHQPSAADDIDIDILGGLDLDDSTVTVPDAPAAPRVPVVVPSDDTDDISDLF